jgi:hypothetical protein
LYQRCRMWIYLYVSNSPYGLAPIKRHKFQKSDEENLPFQVHNYAPFKSQLMECLWFYSGSWLVPKIIHKAGAFEVFLHQWSWKVTKWSLQCKWDIQSMKQTNPFKTFKYLLPKGYGSLNVHKIYIWWYPSRIWILSPFPLHYILLCISIKCNGNGPDLG